MTNYFKLITIAVLSAIIAISQTYNQTQIQMIVSRRLSSTFTANVQSVSTPSCLSSQSFIALSPRQAVQDHL